jgi:predicted component of type VI protein secretion system
MTTVSLIVQRGRQQGRRIPIATPEFLIGRDPSCHLRPASRDVDWQHCAIRTTPEGTFLRDDSRCHGTLLNGRLLLGGEMQLGDGDLITVGPLSFRVAVHHPAAATRPDQRGAESDSRPGHRDAVTEAAPDFPTRVIPYPGLRRAVLSDSREKLCP